MVKTVIRSIFIALMAIWIARSMGALSLRLHQAEELAASLDRAIAAAEAEILELRETNLLELALSRGYIHRGDTVFFDGGAWGPHRVTCVQDA